MIAKASKQRECPSEMNEWRYVYTMEYYSVIKNNVICTNMNEPRDYHTKWSKPGNSYVFKCQQGWLEKKQR